MDRKQSQFTQVNALLGSDFIPAFGQSANKKISKPDLFKQIKDETQIFIYPTVEQLQAANLVADPDWPIYVRVEETGYLLYKITSLAASSEDISLDNGATATLQTEYYETSFVTRPEIDLSNIKVGSVVTTSGCDVAGDGGHATFDVRAGTSLSVDGYGVILSAGKYAIIRPTLGGYNALQFGAKNAGNVGSRDAIQRAIDFVMSQRGYRNLYIPAGTYRIEKSSQTVFPSGGRVSLVIDQENNWVVQGDGRYITTLVYDADDSNSSRIIDITRCNNFIFRGMGLVGDIEPFITPPATTPSATGGFNDRSINGAVLDNGIFEDLYIDNVTMYGMGFQRGPLTNCIFRNIDIGWCGNDGIDIKQNDVNAVFTRDINHNNLFENITGYEFGMLTYEAPNVLLDMRSSYSTANNIVGYSIQNESYLIRTIGGNYCTINDPVAYGTGNTLAEDQNGILVGGAGVVINNPKLYNMYAGVITAFDSSDTIQPWCVVNNPVTDEVVQPIEFFVGDPCTVRGGSIKNSTLRGVRTGNNSIVDGVKFYDCTEAVRIQAGTSGSIVKDCRRFGGGGIVHGSGALPVNTVMNCGDMSSVSRLDFVGNNLSINGVQVLTAQGAAVPNAAGGTEITTINNILARLRAHGIIAT